MALVVRRKSPAIKKSINEAANHNVPTNRTNRIDTFECDTPNKTARRYETGKDSSPKLDAGNNNAIKEIRSSILVLVKYGKVPWNL
ncbi:hypothetical protein LBO01_00300 [Companilactobacillus paralimentarius]|nr:hypothetical protein LBO01_00300 [Companilactobacillus paralimentarius]